MFLIGFIASTLLQLLGVMLLYINMLHTYPLSYAPAIFHPAFFFGTYTALLLIRKVKFKELIPGIIQELLITLYILFFYSYAIGISGP